MSPGDLVTVKVNQDGKVYRADDILPSGHVNLSRRPDPFEQIWDGYRNWTMPAALALKPGTRLHCQVASADHLEPVTNVTT